MFRTYKKIYTPLSLERLKRLKTGDNVLLNGIIYTARDQVHKRLCELIKKNKKLPFTLTDQIIFYCGPTPASPGEVIGSCGPTTSSRMDRYTPFLLKEGLKGMIGKGNRSEEVIQAIKRYKAIYFLTFSGAGAYLSKFVKKAKIIAYPELGPEAIYKLGVEKFPLIVGIDSEGRNIYKENYSETRPKSK